MNPLNGSALLLVAALAVACAPAPEGENGNDAGGSGGDAENCDLSGFSPQDERAETEPVFQLTLYIANDDDKRLTISWVFSGGATTGPQTLDLSTDTSGQNGVEVKLESECDGLNCGVRFAPVEGTLDITALGGDGEPLTGTLSGAVFQEASYDSTTRETTVLEDGQSWCIDSFSFDTVVVDL